MGPAPYGSSYQIMGCISWALKERSLRVAALESAEYHAWHGCEKAIARSRMVVSKTRDVDTKLP